MNTVPIRGSVLSSKVLPTWGGNTEFANCYAAYDDLSDQDKALIDRLLTSPAWAQHMAAPMKPL